MPKVTIMMCTFNRANFIDKALNSVLNQTFQNFEIIIFDDASTDNTKEIVRKFEDPRIIYHYESKNLGITKARNKILKMAKGEFIAVLDSDDLWVDNKKLSEQIEILEKNLELALVGTHTKLIDENEKEIGCIKNEIDFKKIKEKILLKNQFVHSSVLYRKDIISDIGGYDESLFIWEDYDLWLRLGKKYKMENLNEIYTAYRKHSGQISLERKFKGAKTHLEIINRYKKDYPNYFLALLKALLRFGLALF